MFIVDTSVAVKWVTPDDGEGIEAGTGEALDLLTKGLTAPDCMLAEFANALFKKVQRSEIGKDQALASVGVLPDIVSFFPTRPLIGESMRLALEIAHPVHDCVFLAAAMRFGIPLVTADVKFHANCQKAGADFPIKLLGEIV